MTEQPNLKTYVRQEAQAATPPERLVLREGKTFRINGESVLFTIVAPPRNLYLKGTQEERGETYQMMMDRLINRYCPRGANAYLVGDVMSNYLPIVYLKI